MSRTRSSAIRLALVLAGVLLISGTACADFVQTDDFDTWTTALPTFDTITFEELEHGEQAREQYAHLGVHFTDPDQNVVARNWFERCPQDGVGIHGGVVVELSFDDPMRAFGTHFPDRIRMWFYDGDTLLLETGVVGSGGVLGTDRFHGLVLDQDFDRVILRGRPPNPFGDPDTIVLDNLYFSTIPAPGAFAVFTGLAFARRRRRSCRDRSRFSVEATTV